MYFDIFKELAHYRLDAIRRELALAKQNFDIRDLRIIMPPDLAQLLQPYFFTFNGQEHKLYGVKVIVSDEETAIYAKISGKRL